MRRKKLFRQHKSSKNEKQIPDVCEIVDEVEKNGSLSEQCESNVPDEYTSLHDDKGKDKNGCSSDEDSSPSSEVNVYDDLALSDKPEGKDKNGCSSDEGSSSSSEVNVYDDLALSDKPEHDTGESSNLPSTLTSDDDGGDDESVYSCRVIENDENESVYSCRISENGENESTISSETVESVEEELSDLFETDSSEEDANDASVNTSEFSEEDSEEEERRKKQKTKNKTSKQQTTQKPKSRKCQKQLNPKPKNDELNEYEKLVEKNKEEKMAFLNSLRIDEVKESFKEAVESRKEIVKAQKEIVKAQKLARRKDLERDLPRRECLSRRAKIYIDLSEKAVEERGVSGDTTHFLPKTTRAYSDSAEMAAEARALRRDGGVVSVLSSEDETRRNRKRRRLDDLSEKAIFARNLSKTKEETKKLLRLAAHGKLKREAEIAERFRRWAVVKIPTVVFNRRLKKFVKDYSPLQLGVLLNRLPDSGSLRECVTAENSFLAWKYSLCVEPRRGSSSDQDMSLVIRNLRQCLQLPSCPTLKIPTVVFGQRSKKLDWCKSHLQLCVLLNRPPASRSLKKCLAADNYFLSWKYNISTKHRPVTVTGQTPSLDTDDPRQHLESPVEDVRRNGSILSNCTASVRSTRSCCTRVLVDERIKKANEDKSQLQLGVLLNKLPSSGSLEESVAIENSLLSRKYALRNKLKSLKIRY